MDFINLPLLIAAILVLASVTIGLFSARWGFSFLLVFLIAGMLAGEQGPGRVQFNDFILSFWVGNVALAVILLDGGLRTAATTFRTGLRPSLLLATLGVAVTAGITGAAAALLLHLPWREALLLGAVVGSTDAAAVFGLLKRTGLVLNERVATTLEIESGMNDPMAVFMTITMIAVITGTQAGTAPGPLALAASFAQQFGVGTAVGAGAGLLAARWIVRLPAADAGIAALVLVSSGLTVFAAAGLLGGSGFLAVYLYGMVLCNRAESRVAGALSAMDGYAWLAQAGMFLLLGLLVTPSAVLASAGPALGVAAVLMLLARPLAVWLCLRPFHFRAREVGFIAWVGLRGAVPIVLAIFPLLAGVPQAMLLFNVAFVVVLASLGLQGSSLAWTARRLRVTLPGPSDEPRQRAVFGDFTLDGRTPVRDVCEFYALPLPAEGADLPLGQWLARALGRVPVVGDELVLGRITLVVRGMRQGEIAMVGLKLGPAAGEDEAT